MSGLDAVSDTAPTEPRERIPLETIQHLLKLPKKKTVVLTGRDAELFVQLTASRLNVRKANPTWTDQEIDTYLREQFRAQPASNIFSSSF